MRQEVARQLLDGKLVKGLIRIKRSNEIVAISPNHAERIIGIARGIGIPRLIEPKPRPVFAKSIFREQAINQAFVSVRRLVRDEVLHLGRRGSQARQVE